ALLRVTFSPLRYPLPPLFRLGVFTSSASRPHSTRSDPIVLHFPPLPALGRSSPLIYHATEPSCGKSPSIRGPVMDDTLCRQFFVDPAQPFPRRYLALRAFFVDGQSYDAIAAQFGLSYHTVRSWVRDFRAQCQAGQTPPFSPSP